ncbi:hypothetical protein AYO38_05470, partial [bacterium SCGC AG-212-C10]
NHRLNRGEHQRRRFSCGDIHAHHDSRLQISQRHSIANGHCHRSHCGKSHCNDRRAHIEGIVVMNRYTTIAALVLSAAVSGLALRLGSGTTLPWMVARASGLVSFALLSGSVIFGLLMSTKAGSELLSKPLVFTAHQFLSLLMLTFIGLHGGALLFDGFFHFTPLSVIVPFTSPYAPFWVGLGVISAWLSAIVTASFWMRTRIGQKRWRQLHYASFLAYVLGLGHGLTAGSDTGLPLVQFVYIGSAITVAGLLTYRLTAKGKTPGRPASNRAMPLAS